jgi:hypothetical protein
MADSNLDLQTLAKRLEKVEKHGRIIKLMTFLAIVLGISAGFVGSIISSHKNFEQKLVKAEEFQLVDKKGMTRGTMTVDDNDNTFFVLFDKKVNQRLDMIVIPDYVSCIQVHDEENKVSAVSGPSQKVTGLSCTAKENPEWDL